MMCLPDLVIGPPVGVIDGNTDAIENTPLEGRAGGCADFCCPPTWSSAVRQRGVCLSAYMEYELSAVKGDGRWEAAYAGQAAIEAPEDLAKALNANPRARAVFEQLTSSNRYSVLYRIASAKRADTRARRIEQFVDMLARGETIHSQNRLLAE